MSDLNLGKDGVASASLCPGHPRLASRQPKSAVDHRAKSGDDENSSVPIKNKWAKRPNSSSASSFPFGPHLDLALQRKNCESYLPGNFWSK
jgi:hypothetical protein